MTNRLFDVSRMCITINSFDNKLTYLNGIELEATKSQLEKDYNVCMNIVKNVCTDHTDLLLEHMKTDLDEKNETLANEVEKKTTGNDYIFTDQNNHKKIEKCNDKLKAIYQQLFSEYENFDIQITVDEEEVENEVPRSNFKDCNLRDCISLKRMIKIFKQYEQFKSGFDEEMESKCDIKHDDFNFVETVNNFHHLLMHHQQEFEDIHEALTHKVYEQRVCNHMCKSYQRNNRNRQLCDTNQEAMTKLYPRLHSHEIVQQQILDKIHCYYFHSFPHRYKRRNNKQNKSEFES
eukprot:256351_1